MRILDLINFFIIFAPICGGGSLLALNKSNPISNSRVSFYTKFSICYNLTTLLNS